MENGTSPIIGAFSFFDDMCSSEGSFAHAARLAFTAWRTRPSSLGREEGALIGQ